MTSSGPHSLQIAALLLLTAVSAEAQQIAGTFDQLRVLVKPGDTLAITDQSGARVKGKLTELSASTLRLDVSGTPRLFHESEVNTIAQRRPDSLKNGALAGLAVGGGLGALALGAVAASDDYTPLVAIGALLYAGIGAGIGVGIDALIEGPQVIYAGSRPSRAALTIAPIVRGSRKGVLLSMTLTR